MAGSICGIYINNSSVYQGDNRQTFEITETGLKIAGTVVWTYSGTKTFKGFASSQGAVFPTAGLEVGKTLAISDVSAFLGQSYESISVYSVEGAPNRTISLENLYEFKYKLDEVKQDTLVSGTNIKTINNQSILGSGNISIPAPLISLTYAQLKALRDNSQLVPGQQYRITDYQCTTTTRGTSSAGHQFDIIVTADSTNELNEKARAALHSGDTYFANSKLESWQLWYCLDNDTTRFAWADGTNGKGVVHRMIDEFGNDVPYDFKNILFTKSGKYTSAYTFSYTENNAIKDASISGLNKNCYSNIMKKYIASNKQSLNFNVFYSTSASFGCYGNTFGNNCRSNTISERFYNNTIGSEFFSNTIGSEFYNNTIGSNFYSNMIGSNFHNNIIGSYFNNNMIGSWFCDNTIGNAFGSNKIGSYFEFNTIGSGFHHNTIGTSASINVYVRYCKFDDGVQYTSLTSDNTSASSSNYIQNVHVHSGVMGTSSALLTVSIPDRNLPYETDVYLDTNGGPVYVINNADLIEVTYSQLKALRDGGQLVPGQQYRITDYDTSIDSSESAQLGASSAHHQFDIIVTADTESQLNEDARACGHQGDTYFATAFESQSNVQFEYVLYDDSKEEKYDSEGVAHYNDTIMEGRYENGTPVLYKTNTGEYGDKIDYGDWFTYEGDIVFNGVQYNKWHKTEGPGHADTGLDFLTRVIVVNKQFVEQVQVTKVPAAYSCSLWKLKYCLDNDQRRFRWANSYSGKGVIYRMIDEWGNDCPYDFKNMQFKRNILDGKYSREGDGDDKWLYTFSYITKTTPDFEVVDASIAGNREDLQNHDNTPGGVVGNVIGPRYDFSLSQETGPMTTPLVLNDIVFVGSYVYPNPQNPVFDGFHFNVFDDDCYSNTMAGNLLYDNRFGVGCHDNCVEHYCVGNVFGRNNFSNVLESVSDKNTFGPDCSGNHLGGECYNNIFEWGCKDNTVNNDNSNNYFAASCRDNYIDSGSYDNKFGAECVQNFMGEYTNGLILGKECSANRFERDCVDITFGNGCSDNHIAGLTRQCIFDAGVSNIELTSDDTSATSSNWLQNVHVHSGIKGASTSSRKTISVPDRNLPYSIDYYANNSQTIFLD